MCALVLFLVVFHRLWLRLWVDGLGGCLWCLECGLVLCVFPLLCNCYSVDSISYNFSFDVGCWFPLGFVFMTVDWVGRVYGWLWVIGVVIGFCLWV